MSDTLTAAEVLSEIRSRAETRSGGLSGLAREWRLSPQYLHDVVTRRRGLTPRVLGRLGLRAVTVYTRPERSRPPDKNA